MVAAGGLDAGELSSLAELIDFNIHETLDWNLGAALAIVLAVITAICAVVLGRVRGGNLFGEG